MGLLLNLKKVTGIFFSLRNKSTIVNFHRTGMFFTYSWLDSLFNFENSNEELTKNFESIYRYIIRHEIFLKKDLKITDITAELNISTQLLKKSIMYYEAMNFLDFINHFRVQRAISILSASKYKTISFETVGEQAGFQTYSSFNKAFKKEIGKTPKQYKNELIKNDH